MREALSYLPVQSQTWKGQGGSDSDIDDFPLSSIPTTDSAAALRFCQSLAHVLKHSPDLPAPQAVSAPSSASLPYGAESNTPELSVVIPICNEEDNITPLSRRLSAVLEQTGLAYEIIFVDDGSQDRSLELLQQLVLSDAHVTVVELARNFGHQVAVSAGLDYARGQATIVIDGDLQDPPEVLPEFIAKWREGYDVGKYSANPGRLYNSLKNKRFSP